MTKTIDVQKLYNLTYITRYSNVARIKNENVAEHSFFVAVEILDLYQRYDFDLGIALEMAITHDWLETETDDVNHLIKGKYPQLAIELKKAEVEESKKFPEYIRRSMIAYEDQLSFESIICHIADAKQCSRYATNEINRGNKVYMEYVLNGSKARVTELTTRIALLNPERIRKKLIE